MEEIRQTAKAYYKTLPEEAKGSAMDFFTAMDNNGDGKISLHEFASFMTEEGYESMSNSSLFEEINRDKSGNLDFEDVMGLYYIIKSGRPFCRGCTKLIVGAYFTCVKCFESDTTKKTFCLHPSCYENGDYTHHHTAFADNHVMLHELRGRGGLAGANQIIEKMQSPVGSYSNASFTPPIYNQVAQDYLYQHQLMVWNPPINYQMSKWQMCKRAFAVLKTANCTVM